MPNFKKLEPKEQVAYEECKRIMSNLYKLQGSYKEQKLMVRKAFIAIDNGHQADSGNIELNVKNYATYDVKMAKKRERIREWEAEKTKLESIQSQINGCVLLLAIIDYMDHLAYIRFIRHYRLYNKFPMTQKEIKEVDYSKHTAEFNRKYRMILVSAVKIRKKMIDGNVSESVKDVLTIQQQIVREDLLARYKQTNYEGEFYL